jgi:hypothetical protein
VPETGTPCDQAGAEVREGVGAGDVDGRDGLQTTEGAGAEVSVVGAVTAEEDQPRAASRQGNQPSMDQQHASVE